MTTSRERARAYMHDTCKEEGNGGDFKRIDHCPDCESALTAEFEKVRAETVEQCAKVAETRAEQHEAHWYKFSQNSDTGRESAEQRGLMVGAETLARAIRALADTKGVG
jgi:hypothetical protein